MPTPVSCTTACGCSRERSEGRKFEVIVSGQRKGTGSSRETAAQCERWAGIGIVIAASFAPIHERNNINLGQLMGDHAMLERLQNGESIPLAEFTGRYDPVTQLIVEYGGLFPFAKALKAGELDLAPLDTGQRPMTMAERIISRNLVGQPDGQCVNPRPCHCASAGRLFARIHHRSGPHLPQEEYGENYALPNPGKFAVFEDPCSTHNTTRSLCRSCTRCRRYAICKWPSSSTRACGLFRR